uniref:RNA methyltransferase n=1 Tax=Cannabis sativa TaxID=3483 RepID=A0A803NT51_CANSA
MKAEKRKGEERSTKEVEQKKKKHKEIFPYGNYRNYYGYRLGQDIEEDPRLKVMKKEWFEGKDCLDVGCNNGIITIQIAKKFHCQSILGVDIDSNRIEDAYWHLRKFVKIDSAGKIHGKDSKSKDSEDANGLGNNITASSDEETKQNLKISTTLPKNLSDIVSFRQENFVQSRYPPEKFYDAILWQTTAENFKKIIFRPECFQELLLDKIGFRTVEDVTSGLSGSKTGFDRPIFVFRK